MIANALQGASEMFEYKRGNSPIDFNSGTPTTKLDSAFDILMKSIPFVVTVIGAIIGSVN